MKDAFTIYLGTGYLTCSPIKAVGQPEDEPQARTPAPSARLFPPTSASRRHTKLLKATSGLPTEDAIFVTLLWDKGQHGGNLPAPAAISKMREKFNRMFRVAFPQGHGIWKLELDSDKHGVHMHMILTPYGGYPDDSQLQDFTAWTWRTWGKIAHSKWERLVDVKRALSEHPGYLTLARKKASDAALADYMGECHTYGTIGRQNAPKRPTVRYTATREQLAMIREAVMREIRAKARYRGGIVNQRHLSQVEISYYILHVGISEELEQEIKAILAGDAMHKHTEQKQQDSRAQQVRPAAFMPPLGALGVCRGYADTESAIERRGGPSGAVLWLLGHYAKGEGLPPVGWQAHTGATGNMPPPRQSLERLRGP